ncbi:MAG: RadC family protein [Candidatus Porifericomitaceae bacterium WSBS_2022_MAG_OTU9]
MKLRQIPSYDRPREKLSRHGADALSDAELLAIFLRTGVHNMDAIELAHNLLADGGLRPLLDSPVEQLCKKHGIGPSKAVTLKAVLAVAQRYISTPLRNGNTMSKSEDVRNFLTMQLRSHKSEVFACMFLDTQLRLIKFVKMFYGSINKTNVHPRDIVREALGLNASAVIFAHNHPSGIAMPSVADKIITELLQEALMIVDISVVDHIIVGCDDVSSFAELGLL